MTKNLPFTKENLPRDKRILSPTNDVVFKALFGKGKERITKAFLEDILKFKIDSLELDKNQELVDDKIESKSGRLDIRAIINGNVECDIEMQLTTHDKLFERFLYYWSKIYASSLKMGEPYQNLRKTICIVIVNDTIDEFKEIAKSHTKWQIREEEYHSKILTPYLQFDILELPKAIKEYENNKDDELLQWLMFLDNPENTEVAKIMEENKDIKVAKEELDQMSKDDVLWWMALREELAKKDHMQLMYEAEQKGIAKGIAEGKANGEKKKSLEIAKKMLEEKISIETIIKVTGLTKEEIFKLNN